MPRNTQPPAIGEKFGRWTVTGNPAWLWVAGEYRMHVPCRCDCGTEQLNLVQNLRRKDRTNPSCGCWKRERASRDARLRWTKHGQSHAPDNGLYQLWKHMVSRCHNPNADNYRWYGGRGIKVWEPWRHDAGAFIAYVELNLGPRPPEKTPGGAWAYSLDRIDNNGDYAPGNLRWATQFTQVHNRSSGSKGQS